MDEVFNDGKYYSLYDFHVCSKHMSNHVGKIVIIASAVFLPATPF